MKHYQARQRSTRDWGFTTPSGDSFGFLTRADAIRAAANTERQDRHEAMDRTKTGAITLTLRSHFFPDGLPAPAADPLDLQPCKDA